MDTAIEETLRFGVTTLSILNPIGSLPIFLSLTKRHNNSQIKTVSNSCSVAVMLTIILSLLLGQKILNFFGISVASFTIGGGILIFSMAFSMIQAKSSEVKLNEDELENEEVDPREIGIVPLAIPLLSGPGVISSAIIQSNDFSTTTHWVGAILITLLAGLLVKIILVFGRPIGKKLGTLGLNIMTRIMGIILLAISVEMILGGAKEILPILKSQF